MDFDDLRGSAEQNVEIIVKVGYILATTDRSTDKAAGNNDDDDIPLNLH